MKRDLGIEENKKIDYYKDTMYHKLLVIESALKLSDYLFKQEKYNLGLMLLKRANVHDNSKLTGKEFAKMSSIFGNTKSFTNPLMKLSDNEHDVIKEHWAKNRHHPEYFSEFSDMTDLDILEMVCDWFARSKQYKTDFLEFVQTRQETRFKFSEDLFKKIYFYCEVISKEEE